MRTGWFFCLLFLGVLIGLPTAAVALSVSPREMEVSSVGPNTHTSFVVRNTSAEMKPVDVYVLRVTFDRDGNPVYEPADEDFSIFPPQVNIGPGESQVFRVGWVNGPLEKGVFYAVRVGQVPVAQVSSSVMVMSTVELLLLVHPKEGKGELSVSESRVIPVGGERRVVLTVRNTGERLVRLPDARIRLSSGAWSTTIPHDTLSSAFGYGLVLPGASRRFVLPVALPNGVENPVVEVVYEALTR